MSGESTTQDGIARVEQDGRVLSGGTDVGRLEETMERHAPESKETPPEKPTGTGVAPAAPTPPAAEGAPAAPVSRGRQRFADLTREREEARKEAAAAKEAREAAERERDELRAKLTQPAAEAAKPAESPKPEPPKRFPTFEEWIEQGGESDWYAYDDAKNDWRLEQQRERESKTVDDRVREAIEAREAEREFVSTAKAAQERGRKAYPDFDAALKSATGRIPMGKTREESNERAYFIITHPQSEHIQYAILKDEALARKLQASNPYEFGVLVAGLVPAPQAPKPVWTPPPAPYTSVGASTPVTTTSSADAAKAGNMDEYRRKRAAERGVKSRY